jgi:tetraacyldisaccharide 4'-kinase
MNASPWYIDVVSGRAGLWATPLRFLLSIAAIPYASIISARNRRFDSSQAVRLRVPIISVGNITTGGTGKTPLVLRIAEHLLKRNLPTAVVSRGYKSEDGQLGDELTLMSRRLPELICIASPDRVAGVQEAIERGAKVVVLDDAFQHRRIARDLDIVVIDATCPFGFDHVIPRGLLREPLDGLGRADLMVISRSDLVAKPQIEALESRLSRLAPDASRAACTHRPSNPTDVRGRVCRRAGRRAILVAAVGNPNSFVATAKQAGFEPLESIWFPDHHTYTDRDITRIRDVAERTSHDVILTTEKDDVKLSTLDLSRIEPVRVLPIDIAFTGDGESVLTSCIDKVLEESCEEKSVRSSVA